MNNFSNRWMSPKFLIPLIIVAVALITFGAVTISNASVKEVTCTVTDKDRTTKVVDGSSSSDMRVYTADCGTLTVADSVLDWTFSSSDTYSAITPGETYTFKTRGWRIPVFSSFPNIVEVR